MKVVIFIYLPLSLPLILHLKKQLIQESRIKEIIGIDCYVFGIAIKGIF